MLVRLLFRGSAKMVSRSHPEEKQPDTRAEVWINLLVCTASRLKVAPSRGRIGTPLNKGESEMVEFLRGLVVSVVRLGTFESSCGRRLPAVSDRLCHLREHLMPFRICHMRVRPKSFKVAGWIKRFLPPKPFQ